MVNEVRKPPSKKPKLPPGYWKETVTRKFRVAGVTLTITITGYCTAGATDGG